MILKAQARTGFRIREFTIKQLRRAPIIKPLWDEFERMQAARDSAFAERDAALAERDAALATREAALIERDAARVERQHWLGSPNNTHPEQLQERLPREWLGADATLTEDSYLTHFVDTFFAFRRTLYVSGWCLHKECSIRSVFIVFSSRIYRFPITWIAGIKLPFSLNVQIPGDQVDANIMVGFEYSDGRRFLIEHPFRQSWDLDPYHRIGATFQQRVREIGSGMILEIGSRSGGVYTGFIPSTMKYVGIDIVEGPNVDVVGDAHSLSKYFEPSTFDAVFSIAVFEHLLMPWKVAIEINKILKMNGLLLIGTHQTFPLHAEPWDFWRFSDHSWRGIFNKYTGFEVLDTAMGEPAFIVGSFLNRMTYRLDEQRAFMASTVICRKIGESTLEWPVDLERLIQTPYPYHTNTGPG
jgi:SAM-dependent methyltransferase